jgi:hypothetical protein
VGSVAVLAKQAPNLTIHRVLPGFHRQKGIWLTIGWRSDTQEMAADWEVEMDNGSDGGERLLAISDIELLRRIGQDLRSIYAEVIRQPLPQRIQATLALIDREQRLAEQLPRVLPH